MTDPVSADGTDLWVWRHPRAQGAAGRCIGRSDLPVDRRRAKRLAHRIRQVARRHGLAREVWSSPLRRSAEVGRWLRRWGWRHHVDPALAEMDFGAWDGRAWSGIGEQAVAAWCADFLQHRPGGGEALATLFARVRAWRAPRAGGASPGPAVMVGHAGWMLARAWLASGRPLPQDARDWPAAPPHGGCLKLAAPA